MPFTFHLPMRHFLALAGSLLFSTWAAADLIVAQVTPLSGPLASTGSHMKAGAQLYFDAINAAGGVNGNKIRLVVRDDGYKSSETVRLVREMAKEHQPLAFFGVVGTGNVEALLQEKVLDQAGIPLIGARTGASSISGSGNPWLFLTRASYQEEIAKVIRQYIPMGYRRIAALYQNDAFGQDGLKSVEAIVREAGGELVAKAAYEKNTTRVEAAVKAIVESNPQLVMMISNTAASAEFVKQLRATGNLAQLNTLSVTDAGQVVQSLGQATAHGLAISQVTPDPGNNAVPLIREIRERLKKHPQAEVTLNHTLVEGYIGAKVLTEALRRAGPNPTARKLRDSLDEIRNFDVGGMIITFTPENHLGSRYSESTIISRSGQLVR